jgi:hypothetical protein
VDASRAFGSVQLDEFAKHNHRSAPALSSGAVEWRFGVEVGYSNVRGARPSSNSNRDGAALTSKEGGSETRPRNVALMYVMRVLP